MFEHVGAATFSTSVFVCKTFGTIVICGATSGFNLDFDVRYLWMRQKRIIGSHFANAYQCHRANQLIIEGKIKPVLSRVFPFDECPAPHQMMKENQHVGKMVVLVGAEREGEGASAMSDRPRPFSLARRCARRPTRRGWATPAAIPTPAASTATCTADARGRSASTRASARPRRPTAGSGS